MYHRSDTAPVYAPRTCRLHVASVGLLVVSQVRPTSAGLCPHLVRFQPILTGVGPHLVPFDFGSIFTYFGLGRITRRWPKLAKVGSILPSLTGVGQIWANRAQFRPKLTRFGRIRPTSAEVRPDIDQIRPIVAQLAPKLDKLPPNLVKTGQPQVNHRQTDREHVSCMEWHINGAESERS